MFADSAPFVVPGMQTSLQVCWQAVRDLPSFQSWLLTTPQAGQTSFEIMLSHSFIFSGEEVGGVCMFECKSEDLQGLILAYQ